MEIKTGKWGRSPYRLFWYLILLLAAAVFLAGFWFLYRDGREKGVRILGDSCAPGQELEADMTRIRPYEVESCVWYAGEEEVSREGRLHSYAVREEDEERFIRLEVTLKDGSVYRDYRYCSALPVLYLESGTAYEDVEREEETVVFARLEGRGYAPDKLYEGDAWIHVRGNSTATLDKRPFKLQLEEKAGLLGMRESRHWALLANAIDASLLRNQAASLISESLGAERVMDSRQIILIYNGEYYGVYQLYEQIRVEDGRIDIYDWEQTARDAAERIVDSFEIEGEDRYERRREADRLLELLETELTEDLSWLDTGSFVSEGIERWNRRQGTSYPAVFAMENYLDMDSLPEAAGGVLLEMDFREEDMDPAGKLETNYRQPFYFASPSAGGSFQELDEYISAEIQALEYAIHDTDFTYHRGNIYYETADEGWCNYGDNFAREDVVYRPSEFSDGRFDGLHYSELIDLDSLVNNFLLCEFSMNWDAMKNSVFLYKDLEGPYYIDLVWDYDWGWGNSMHNLNTWYPEEWQTNSAYYANETYYQTVQWNRFLIRDPYFLARVWEKYWQIREPFLEASELPLPVKGVDVVQIRQGHLPDKEALRLRDLHRKPQGPGVDIPKEGQIDLLEALQQDPAAGKPLLLQGRVHIADADKPQGAGRLLLPIRLHQAQKVVRPLRKAQGRLPEGSRVPEGLSVLLWDLGPGKLISVQLLLQKPGPGGGYQKPFEHFSKTPLRLPSFPLL